VIIRLYGRDVERSGGLVGRRFLFSGGFKYCPCPSGCWTDGRWIFLFPTAAYHSRKSFGVKGYFDNILVSFHARLRQHDRTCKAHAGPGVKILAPWAKRPIAWRARRRWAWPAGIAPRARPARRASEAAQGHARQEPRASAG
jgi:hypothetical protein